MEYLVEIVSRNKELFKISPALIKSEFIRSTTLSELLMNPGRSLDELRVTPLVGEVSVLRLKQLIFSELGERYPVEWNYVTSVGAGSAYATGIEKPHDQDVVRKLQKFYDVWGYAPDTMRVSGKFHDGDKNNIWSILTTVRLSDMALSYVPITIPEFVKISDVYKAETGRDGGGRHSIEQIVRRLSESQILPRGSVIVLDIERLTALVELKNDYCDLTTASVKAQLEILRSFFFDEGSPQGVVVNCQKLGLAPGFSARNGPLYVSCLNGCLELDSPEMVAYFHKKIRSATSVGMPVINWLEKYGICN
jgi:hypothetical protein